MSFRVKKDLRLKSSQQITASNFNRLGVARRNETSANPWTDKLYNLLYPPWLVWDQCRQDAIRYSANAFCPGGKPEQVTDHKIKW